MQGEARLRGLACALGRMEIENLFRYALVPWGWSPRLHRAKPACAGWRAPSGEWKLRIYSGMRSCRRA